MYSPGVWESLMTPESAVLIGAGVVKAFRVPGTPVGVASEQQCVVCDIRGSLQIHMVEVVEAKPPYKILTRWLTMPTQGLSTSTLTPTATGTKYNGPMWLPGGERCGKKTHPEVLRAMTDSHVRLKACVEAATWFPGAAP